MKKFVAQINDGGFVNIDADRMTFDGEYIVVQRGDETVAVLDINVVLMAHISEKGVGK